MKKMTISRTFRVMFAVGLFLILTDSSAFSATKTAGGFVTRIISTSDFYLGPFHVLIDAKAQCTRGDIESDIQLQNLPYAAVFSRRFFAAHYRFHRNNSGVLSCGTEHLIIGQYVKVSGKCANSADLMLADHLTIYDSTMRQTIASLPGSDKWDGGALVEEEPVLHDTEEGYIGTVWLDGYPMTVSRDTTLSAATTGSLLSFRGFGFPGGLMYPTWGVVPAPSRALSVSLSLFKPNTWAIYKTIKPQDYRWVGERGGSALENLNLVRLQLWRNSVSNTESEYRAKLTPYFRPPDYIRHRPGMIGFMHSSTAAGIRVLAYARVQDYVSTLGESVVPTYQRELTDQDRTKIHFRFFVVQREHPIQTDEMSDIHGFSVVATKQGSGAIVALPDGVVLVPDYVLARIGNEAELVSILSSAVTVVLQKQRFISKNSRPAAWQPEYGSNPTQFLLSLLEDEQSLRLGIRQMYLAGYDIREAPYAWAVAQGKPVNNPVIDSKDPDKEIPWYAAYAFDYISKYYRDVDYSKLKRGEQEYQQFLQELRKADPEAFAPQK